MNEMNRKYLRSLTEAEYDQAEAIEAEIGKILQEGFTEDMGVEFVWAVMALRKMNPECKVGSIYETALHMGLRELLAKIIRERQSSKPKPRRSGSALR